MTAADRRRGQISAVPSSAKTKYSTSTAGIDVSTCEKLPEPCLIKDVTDGLSSRYPYLAADRLGPLPVRRARVTYLP